MKSALIAAAVAAAMFSLSQSAQAAETKAGEEKLLCLTVAETAKAEHIDTVRNNPTEYLDQYKEGGLGLVTDTRSMAGTDRTVPDMLIKLAATANESQSSAIGSGLAGAVLACSSKDQTYAQSIQQMVAQSGNKALIAAFLAADSSNSVASIGARASAVQGGGDIGGDISGQESAPNSYRSSGDSPTDTESGQYEIGDSGSARLASVSSSR